MLSVMLSSKHWINVSFYPPALTALLSVCFQIGTTVAEPRAVVPLLQREWLLGNLPGEPAHVCVPHGGHPLPAAHPLRDWWKQQLRHVQPGQHLTMRLLQQGLQAVPWTLRAAERGL